MSAEDEYDFDDLAEFDDDSEPDRGSGLAGVVLEALREGDITVADIIEPDEVSLSRTASGGSVGVATPATKDSEAIRRPLISGHCASPATADPKESHARCQRNGGGSRANPDKVFQPCPCLCHFPPERYECGGCGGTILAAPHYPVDEDGDMRYVHLDTKRNRAVDGECPR